MIRKLLLSAVWLLVGTAGAADIPIGFLSWDVTQPGAAGQFDIANETGPNSSTDQSFPVITPVSLGNLTLTIQFSDASIRQFAFTDFTLNPFDGLSYESPSIPIGGFNPQPVSASLSGQFLTTTITLNNGFQSPINPDFTVLLGNGRPLSDGDLGLILAQTQVAPPSPVPEPAAWILIAVGGLPLTLAGRFFMRANRKV